MLFYLEYESSQYLFAYPFGNLCEHANCNCLC